MSGQKPFNLSDFTVKKLLKNNDKKVRQIFEFVIKLTVLVGCFVFELKKQEILYIRVGQNAGF